MLSRRWPSATGPALLLKDAPPRPVRPAMRDLVDMRAIRREARGKPNAAHVASTIWRLARRSVERRVVSFDQTLRFALPA